MLDSEIVQKLILFGETVNKMPFQRLNKSIDRGCGNLEQKHEIDQNIGHTALVLSSYSRSSLVWLDRYGDMHAIQVAGALA